MKKAGTLPTALIAVAASLTASSASANPVQDGMADTIAQVYGKPARQAVANAFIIKSYLDQRKAGEADPAAQQECIDAEANFREYAQTNPKAAEAITNAMSFLGWDLSSVLEANGDPLCPSPDSEPAKVTAPVLKAALRTGDVVQFQLGTESAVTTAINCGVTDPRLNAAIILETPESPSRSIFKKTPNGEFMGIVTEPNSTTAFVQILNASGTASVTAHCGYDANAVSVSNCKKVSSPPYSNQQLNQEKNEIDAGCDAKLQDLNLSSLQAEPNAEKARNNSAAMILNRAAAVARAVYGAK